MGLFNATVWSNNFKSNIYTGGHTGTNSRITFKSQRRNQVNPLNAELNPICHLLTIFLTLVGYGLLWKENPHNKYASQTEAVTKRKDSHLQPGQEFTSIPSSPDPFRGPVILHFNTSTDQKSFIGIKRLQRKSRHT